MATRLTAIADDTVAWLEDQEWLAPIEERLQRGLIAAFESAGSAGTAVKNFLHGVWLGHPVHPMLTDVPLGAWTAAFVLDLMEARAPRVQARQYAKGADTCIAVGIAGAAGAAVTGLTDWSATDGAPRRTGLVHAALNTTALALYVGSLLLRRRGKRGEARALAFAGAGVVTAAAYLGGTLVYKERVGVDHSEKPASDGFVAALAESELQEGRMHRVVVNGMRVLVVRRYGRIYAMGEVCSHMGGPLSEGVCEGSSVRCPWHGSRFALDDGDVLEGPATQAQGCWDVRLRDGQVEVRPQPPEPAGRG
jgi:nitrite reductase/ring-hydroxylating ferredoxin subunit/uncharacterized membrane protein